MSKYIFVLSLLVYSITYGQNTFKAVVKNGETNEKLIGATAELLKSSNGAITNEQGFLELKNIPNGLQQINFSLIGFETKMLSFSFPVSDTFQITLSQKEEPELDEVVIQSTRTNRTIKNTPTRIETIDGEELDEKGNMKPANVSMVLHESTGLQVQ